MSQLTRREREKAEHRRAIIEAAEDVFAQKGFHRATMHEIAERAEFSVGYLYTLFENKDDLYVELVDARTLEYVAHVEASIGRHEGVVEKVKAAIEAILEFFVKRQQFFRIFMKVGTDGGDEVRPGMPERCLRRYEEYTVRLAEVFAEGTRRGVFIDADPVMLVLCMEGMAHGAVHRCAAAGGPEGDVAEALQRMFFHGIVTGEATT